jgi:REP element-mobilizing transposase RayT
VSAPGNDEKEQSSEGASYIMGQSLVKNYMHIVFSTKERQPYIDEKISEEVHVYLGGICKQLECQPIKIGGFTDHFHILCLLSKKVALVKLIEDVKSHSSKWLKTKGADYQEFYWQTGYGAFSVNPSEVELAIEYISNQKARHTKLSFQDEYRAFLKKYNVEFDERYLWE